WTPPKNTLNTSIRSYSTTKKSDRIDAEYYQSKYDAILEKISSYQGGYKTLGEISTIIKSIEPGSSEYNTDGIPFVRIANLTPYTLNLDNTVKLTEKFYNQNQKYQPQQGEILLSKDGTAGIAHYLYDEPQRMITSSGILRVKADNSFICGEVLALLLNSRVISNQIEQTTGGAIILHWRTEDILATRVPLIDKKIQEQIASKITEAQQNRQRSKSLLEQAKITVEHAIEHGE
ncbi:MAG: restriction endonuclease subunit S, partial [Chitinophagaceae bacterium]